MDIVCIATDYDGTLAHDGEVDEPTLEALQDFERSGRKLILVTVRPATQTLPEWMDKEIGDRVADQEEHAPFPPLNNDTALSRPRMP